MQIDFMNYIKSFLVGGALCAAAQILIDKTKLTPARILVGYVCSGVVLSAAGLYKPLSDFAGYGASIPLTGFGHLLAQGTSRAVDSEGIFGALSGALGATAAGICAAIVFGYIFAMIFRAKSK